MGYRFLECARLVICFGVVSPALFLTFSFSLVYDRSCIERFAQEAAILVSIADPCICEKCFSAEEKSFTLRVTCAYEVTECLGFDGASVVC